MRRESPKRRARRPDRRAVVAAAFRRDVYRCRAVNLLPEIVCSGPLDPHEVIPRSVWPDGQYEVSNVVTLCRAHHDHVTDHPAEAHALGLHGWSWEVPPPAP